ncbi:metallophosphoesterase [Euzebya sp.]|uniref:metallophosphoesterase family protein n=1 Tax=Euzebya sp. TaxID=1971409 RepID=UPI0035187FF6
MTARRVLIIGDTHGTWAAILDALELARRVCADRVVSVGDFGIWPGDGEGLLDATDWACLNHGVDVLIVPGNHEDYDQIDAAPVDDDGMHALRPAVRAVPRGHAWRQHGRWWLGFSGAASIDGPGGTWPQVRGPFYGPSGMAMGDRGGWWPGERITDDDVARAHAAIDRVEADGGRVEVLITHDCPPWVPLGYTEPFPLGDEQRQRIGAVADRARADWQFYGHHHRHRVDRAPWGGHAVMLAADHTPEEGPQWVVVETPSDPTEPISGLRPTTWTVDGALGRSGKLTAGPLEPLGTR